MALITTCALYAILIFAVFLAYSYLKFKLFSRNHWKRLNIPYMEPVFIFGNTMTSYITESLGEILQRIYLENREKPLFGVWIHRRPFLLVQDVDLIKNMLVKDFEHFHDRGLYVDEKKEPLEAHLFNLSGNKWRNLRVKLTPTFTSGKMKMKFPTMVECGEELQEFLKPPAENGETIEVKDILARFTTDIISSCAFGIQTNSLKNPDAEFRRYGRRIFSPGKYFTILGYLLNNFRFLQKFIALRRRPSDITNFFMNAVKETIETREKNNIKRNDFMDLIIQLKNKGCIEGADAYGDKEFSTTDFTIETAAAQAFVFFSAGFETSSTTMIFALYELARNPELQRKLQKEIDTVLAKHNNKVTYEAVQEMEYLDCVVNGSHIIPIVGIQNDPRYFPNPDKFDPDRFTTEEKAKRDKFLHIPFGEGPRICIGNRFGLLQSKTGLIFMLSKYNVEVSETTPIPMKLDPASFIPSPAKGMNLKITKRQV